MILWLLSTAIVGTEGQSHSVFAFQCQSSIAEQLFVVAECWSFCSGIRPSTGALWCHHFVIFCQYRHWTELTSHLAHSNSFWKRVFLGIWLHSELMAIRKYIIKLSKLVVVKKKVFLGTFATYVQCSAEHLKNIICWRNTDLGNMYVMMLWCYLLMHWWGIVDSWFNSFFVQWLVPENLSCHCRSLGFLLVIENSVVEQKQSDVVIWVIWHVCFCATDQNLSGLFAIVGFGLVSVFGCAVSGCWKTSLIDWIVLVMMLVIMVMVVSWVLNSTPHIIDHLEDVAVVMLAW